MKPCSKCRQELQDSEITYLGKCKSCKRKDDDDYDDAQRRANDDTMNAALVAIMSAAACS